MITIGPVQLPPCRLASRIQPAMAGCSRIPGRELRTPLVYSHHTGSAIPSSSVVAALPRLNGGPALLPAVGLALH